MTSTRIELRAADGVRLTGRLWPSTDRDLAYCVAHGFTGSSAAPEVQRICRRLAGRGAAVLAMDFRGHGGSGGMTSIGVDEELDVAAGIAHLRHAGFDRVVAAGWSMGGSVVIRHAALREPSGAPEARIDAVVSVSSPGLWYERSTPAMRRVHFAGETWLGRRLVGALRHTRVGPGRGWDELPESPVELAGRIRVPLLVVHGVSDHYFPMRHGRAIAAAAPGATLWEEAGMGHAETATTDGLVDRIDTWVRTAIDADRPTDRPDRADLGP